MLIALDLGGVCVNVNSEIMRCEIQVRTAGHISPAELAEKEQKLRFFWEGLERGRISTDDFFSAMHRLSKGVLSVKELADLWCSQIGDPVSGTFEAARELVKRGHEIIFFSNTSEIHLLEIKRKCPIWELKKGGVYSFETGFMKPEEEIYACFEKTVGVPDFFFDDNASNVAAAQARGWNAVCFRSSADLQCLL